MAVLHLLLKGESRARAIPELADVVAKHNAWSQGRKFLLVPYHMIGARSMESAILGHYAEHVRTLHPEAPLPGVYLAERIFDDAAKLRTQLGDEAFFAELNAGGRGRRLGHARGGVDARASTRRLRRRPDARSVQAARGRPVDRFFRAYRQGRRGPDEAFVSLDDGLSIISKHARSLGYDAVVLFLDELILWLASHAADLALRESTKGRSWPSSSRPRPPIGRSRWSASSPASATSATWWATTSPARSSSRSPTCSSGGTRASTPSRSRTATCRSSPSAAC